MIYVDATQEYPRELIAPSARHAGSKWCHLWHSQNDQAELVKFATRIGLNPTWIQTKRPDFIHFDLTPRKRRAAVLNGAIEMPLTTWLRERRTAGVPCNGEHPG